ncbi:MAG: flagellar basal body P-ring formation chaperone FlgA, partial [Mycobacterium sp.]
KECNILTRLVWAARSAVLLAVATGTATAGVVRIWPTAVVDGNQVTLRDICDVSGLDSNVQAEIEAQSVASAPPPGGSTSISAADVQAALRKSGANLATLLLTGATHCAVTRPKVVATVGVPRGSDSLRRDKSAAGAATLQDAVYRAFEEHTRRYGGRIDLQFGRTSRQVLNLSEPDYAFDVDVRGGRWIGRMIKIDVEVLAHGRQVQSVHLIANAALIKRVVVARRAINLQATIRPEDVGPAERSYDNPEQIGVASVDTVVGQRTRRFIPTGATIRLTDIEMVPLVKRGQLVTVISRAGGIEVRSAAKAVTGGGLGDTVELRAGGRRGRLLSGVVTGVRRVTIGPPAVSSDTYETQLALGEADAR